MALGEILYVVEEHGEHPPVNGMKIPGLVDGNENDTISYLHLEIR